MTDRFLYTVLMICVALGGALAIGADLAHDRTLAREARLPVVQLEPVVVTAKRLATNANVALFERGERSEPTARHAE